MDGMQIARWAVQDDPTAADFYVGLQFTLAGLRRYINPNYCEYHVGNETVAPGGYVWMFPKDEESANVGIVISAKRAREVSAQTWLERFVERHYPGVSILNVVAGGIPVTGAIKQMVMGGLMIVGDAAHQADPLTAGGISLGMMGAEMAMQVAVPAIKRGMFRRKRSVNMNSYGRNVSARCTRRCLPYGKFFRGWSKSSSMP
jgi:digeranylgeranylglycerophospholipid reductase